MTYIQDILQYHMLKKQSKNYVLVLKRWNVHKQIFTWLYTSYDELQKCEQNSWKNLNREIGKRIYVLIIQYFEQQLLQDNFDNVIDVKI